ncbi:DUF2490 domain-containing protein [Hymenobacter swuensis]|uniref:DUF2490 domain-containing protein n=1 Tax=Hymenobacter swuensis DY53 TaxID=1227739 RepID=W8F2C6_9BACT|nr:DUF2490 domain-containing protein [Hymenobacter swuensis]AHJ99083.1 hypothetical protein Hsw_3488 [Hymenobacter swuensis DY53]
MQKSTPFLWRGTMLLASLMLRMLHPASAQQTPRPAMRSNVSNAWLIFLSDTRLSKRWGIHAEAQVLRSRSSALGCQNVFRAGANYYVVDNLLLTGGYAYSQSALDGGLPGAPEHRLYQQVQLCDTKSRVQLQHRYRLEERWVQVQPGQQFIYLNRMRYQLRLTLPLIGKKLTEGVPFLVGSNEVFLGFGRNENKRLLQQNRAYLGLGYQITKAAAVEIGYLNQLVLPRQESRFEVNENVQFSLCFNPDLRPTASPATH